MNSHSQPEHRWLNRLVGDWHSEMDCQMGSDQLPTKSKGFETVRSLGELWMVTDATHQTPDGDTGRSQMTLGYDCQQGCFVGTFLCSMMTHLWIYRGTLNEAGTVLILDTEGPNLTQGDMAQYQDRIEFISHDHRTMTSHILNEQGQWHHFMTAHYWRKSDTDL